MARIWRASFASASSASSASREVEVVIVEAEKVASSETSHYAATAQALLQMQNTWDCYKNWPFEAEMGLEHLLRQVRNEDGWSGFADYLTWPYSEEGTLHAIGLGSNKKRRKQAALLALMLSRLVIPPWRAPKCQADSLKNFLDQAKTVPVMRLNQVPGVEVAGEESSLLRPSEEPMVPKEAFFWIDSTTLVVLCEDGLASIFKDSKNWFYQAAGVNQEPEPEELRDLQGATRKDFRRIFPDIFFTSLFRHDGYRVIGVGRDVMHRGRAGCLGLAALICQRDWTSLTRVRRLVMDEISRSGWFPAEPLQRFYDTGRRGFWQNMEMWAEGRRDEVFSKRALSDIRMTCQPALLKQLEQRPHTELDLTNTGLPWRGILKGHKEAAQLTAAKRFLVVADCEKLDKFQECPMVYFAVDVDGCQHTFQELDRTDATMFQKVERKDETLAYRHAAGWEVKQRWKAFQANVFQTLISHFKATHRPNGYLEDDFQPPCATHASLHAWRLSPSLAGTFLHWLNHDRARCEEVEEVRRNCGDEMRDAFDSAVQGLFQDLEMEEPSEAASTEREPPWRQGHTAGAGKFTPWQISMLKAAVKQNASYIRNLDPSRCEQAEVAFWWKWHRASEDVIRFGHQNVSDRFIHGHDCSLETTIQELVDGKTNSEDIPALVAIEYHSLKLVICGNRRLKCYKEALRRGKNCWFKMITHPFPSCDTIKDPLQKLALTCKALEAVNTLNDGIDVPVHKKRRVPRG